MVDRAEAGVDHPQHSPSGSSSSRYLTENVDMIVIRLGRK